MKTHIGFIGRNSHNGKLKVHVFTEHHYKEAMGDYHEDYKGDVQSNVVREIPELEALHLVNKWNSVDSNWHYFLGEGKNND
jgi:hypothetical protein